MATKKCHYLYFIVKIRKLHRDPTTPKLHLRDTSSPPNQHISLDPSSPHDLHHPQNLPHEPRSVVPHHAMTTLDIVGARSARPPQGALGVGGGDEGVTEGAFELDGFGEAGVRVGDENGL